MGVCEHAAWPRVLQHHHILAVSVLIGAKGLFPKASPIKEGSWPSRNIPGPAFGQRVREQYVGGEKKGRPRLGTPQRESKRQGRGRAPLYWCLFL